MSTQAWQHLSAQANVAQLHQTLDETIITGKELLPIRVMDSAEYENGFYVDCNDVSGMQLLTVDDSSELSKATTNLDFLSRKIGWTDKVLKLVEARAEDSELNPHLQYLFVKDDLGQAAIGGTITN